VEPAAPVEQPEAVPSPGRLWISAEPWAWVNVDGVRVGRTPIIGVPIAAGEHLVRLEREGYAPLERELTVAAGTEVRLTGLRLEARQ
jgi:serine/threonine-protein kinase